MSDELRANPYVGLRPFFAEDSLYFYGRERQTAELLGILREHRFLSVVGSSGSGKSSLVRAGLLPGLLGGFLVHDRDRWRTIQIKPGDAPITNLAEGLFRKMAPPSGTAAALEEGIRSQHTDAVMHFLGGLLDQRTNVFILIDQFEEIFAFRGGVAADGVVLDVNARKDRARRHAEAADFVDLLLRLAEQRDLPIYVALTMRTDFLGECDLFYGLPEALNRGRYLVPRLTREQLRDVIECPAMLRGAEMAPRLLDHVLNEVGDRADRLPMLQHALLRTWGAWQAAGQAGPVDIAHYLAAGGIDGALNQDAEGAMTGLDRDAVGRIFKRLTDTDASERRVRSPARISELMAASGQARPGVEAILTRFEENGRNFVYRSADGKPDDPRIDISHESLIRQWSSLTAWVDEERASSATFKNLVLQARRRADGTAGLLQDPELEIAFAWRKRERPSSGWAERHSRAVDDFASAVGYLDDSVNARSRELAEKVLARRWTRRWAPVLALLIAGLAFGGYTRQLQDSLLFLLPPVTTPSVLQMPEVPFVRIRGLTWTTSDSRRTLDLAAADRYCRELPSLIGPADGRDRRPSFWRLPTLSELGDIYLPAGGARKLRAEFQAGVSSDVVWSSDLASLSESERDLPYFVVDFRRALSVPLSQSIGHTASALCVSDQYHRFTEDRQEALASFERDRRANQLLLGLLYAGVFVLLYVVLAPLARWLQRTLTFRALVDRFASAGGREPVAEANRLDAATVHQTTYASAWRRLTAWSIDVTVYFAVISAGIALFIWLGERRVIVEYPDGREVAATLLDRGEGWASVRTPDGGAFRFSTRQPKDPERVGTPAVQRLPAGFTINPRRDNPFFIQEFAIDQPLYRVMSEAGEQWFGTIGATSADQRSFTLEISPYRWQLARDAWSADLAWRFGSDQAAIQAEQAAWLRRNPPPRDGDAVRTFPIYGYSWRYDAETNVALLYVWIPLGLAFGWFYVLLQICSERRATLGMWIAGVIRTTVHGERLSFGQANAWLAARFVSYLTLGAGFLLQPFTKQRQTLHDRLAGSVVLRRPHRVITPRNRVVMGMSVAAVVLFAAVSAVVLRQILAGEGNSAGSIPASAIEAGWPDHGIAMFVDPNVDGRRFGLAEPARINGFEIEQPLVIERSAAVKARLKSMLILTPPVWCPQGGCPVGFRYGVDAVNGKGETIQTMLDESSPCGEPVFSVSGPERSEGFERDLTFTAPAVGGEYRVWIDFTRITGCGSDQYPRNNSTTKFRLFRFTVK